MSKTYTISDSRINAALVMAVSEANAFEYFLRRMAQNLRGEADRIEAFLDGNIDASMEQKMRLSTSASMPCEGPFHHLRTWYKTIKKEIEEAAQKL